MTREELIGSLRSCGELVKEHKLDACAAVMRAAADRMEDEGWISVEDRLPDDGCTYLVVVKLKYEWETEWEYHVDAGTRVFCNGYIDGIWDTANDWDEGQECHITHWMPLPEPPKMKGE